MSGRASIDTPPDLAKLAALIRERRHSAWLPMAALASQAGISRSTLHRVERMDLGHRAASPSRPTPRNVAAVLRALGVRPAEVLEMVGCEQWGLEVLSRLSALTPAEPWLRAERAAEYLGVGLGTLLRLRRAGLPHHRMSDSQNGVSLYLASELDLWRTSHARLPRTPPVNVRRPRYQPRG